MCPPVVAEPVRQKRVGIGLQRYLGHYIAKVENSQTGLDEGCHFFRINSCRGAAADKERMEIPGSGPGMRSHHLCLADKRLHIAVFNIILCLRERREGAVWAFRLTEWNMGIYSGAP